MIFLRSFFLICFSRFAAFGFDAIAPSTATLRPAAALTASRGRHGYKISGVKKECSKAEQLRLFYMWLVILFGVSVYVWGCLLHTLKMVSGKLQQEELLSQRYMHGSSNACKEHIWSYSQRGACNHDCLCFKWSHGKTCRRLNFPKPAQKQVSDPGYIRTASSRSL